MLMLYHRHHWMGLSEHFICVTAKLRASKSILGGVSVFSDSYCNKGTKTARAVWGQRDGYLADLTVQSLTPWGSLMMKRILKSRDVPWQLTVLTKSSFWRVNVLLALTYLSKNPPDNLISRIFSLVLFQTPKVSYIHSLPPMETNLCSRRLSCINIQTELFGNSLSCINSFDELIDCCYASFQVVSDSGVWKAGPGERLEKNFSNQ
jgi:hypothetical protein